MSDSPLIGFAAIATAMFFVGAVQLLGIGVLGEYVGRIYEEVKRRPLYTVREIGGVRHRVASGGMNARLIVEGPQLGTSDVARVSRQRP